MDSETQWMYYEMEETEVKIDVADMVMEQLVTETADILIQLEHCRTKIN